MSDRSSAPCRDVPRKGNVDRNAANAQVQYQAEDVPRKGNVDRNADDNVVKVETDMTFPARGTWIEIYDWQREQIKRDTTFPARGTWIEILIRISS